MSLVDRLRRGWRWCHRSRTSTAATWTATAICLLAAVAWQLASTRYQFALNPRGIGRQDMGALTQLADDLRRIGEWRPAYVEPAQVQLLADWIHHPGNATAQRWPELYRGDSREFASINGMIRLLDQQGDVSIQELRELETGRLPTELSRRLERIAEQTREISLLKVVGQAPNRELIGRLRMPSAPAAVRQPSGVMGWLTRGRSGNVEAWAEAFVSAVDANIRPIEERYRAMETAQVAPLGGDADLRLALKPLVAAESGRLSLVYAAEQSTSDWEVWVRVATTAPDDMSSQQLEWDTGLRLVCVPWTKISPVGGFRPDWPTGESRVACELPRLNEFLHEIGMPRGLEATSGSAMLDGDWNSPRVKLRFELGSSQFPDWRYAGDLDLPAASSAEWFAGVSQSSRAARLGLREHVLGLTEYCGCKVRCTAVKGDDRSIAATLEHAQWGSLHLSGVLDDDGRLRWQPLPSFEDRVRLTDQLLASRPDLKGLESRLVLTAVQLFEHESRVDVRWQLRPEPGATPAASATAGSSNTSAANVDASTPKEQAIVWSAQDAANLPAPRVSATAEQQAAAARQAADAAAASPKPESSQPATDPAKLAAAARDHLARAYAPLARSLQLATAPVADGISIRLGVTISDWPVLALGPARARTVDEVRATLDQLLSLDSVGLAVVEQWHGTDGWLAHPRYGPIRCALKNWSPANGQATVQCTMNLPHLGDVDWAEQTDAALDGTWSRADEIEVANQLRPDIEEALEHAQSELLDWIGLPDVGRLELDPTGIDGDRWLSFSPPRVALRCWARMPFLGLKLQAGRCWLDHEGIHAPREVGIVVPGTLSLPYFAVSEPSVALGFRDRALRLSGKVTPPAPPGPGPNPWLEVGYTELAVGGEMNKNAWTAPKLRGSGDVTVAGRNNVSHGMLGVDFGNGNVDGDFMAKAPLPGMTTVPAKLDGQLAYRGESHAFDMAGRGTLFDEDIANINFEMGKQEHSAARPFDLAGRVRVPHVARIVVRGDASNKMEAFTLKGKGSAGPFTCRFKATEEGVETETGIATSSGGMMYVNQWDPSLVTLNTEDPTKTRESPASLKGWVDGLPLRSASESEQQFAQARVVVEPDPQDVGGAGGSLFGSFGDPRSTYREYSKNALKGDGNSVLVRDPATERVLCRIPATPTVDQATNLRRYRIGSGGPMDLELNGNGYALVIEWLQGGGGEILIGQPDQGKWARVRFAPDQTAESPVIDTLASLALATGPLDPLSADDRTRSELIWQTLKMSFEIGVIRSRSQGGMIPPRRLPHDDLIDGFALDFAPTAAPDPTSAPPPLNRRWLWLEGRTAEWLDLVAPHVPSDVDSRRDFVEAVRADERALRTLFAGKTVARRLVHAREASKSTTGDAAAPAWSLGWLVRTMKGPDGDVLVWRHETGLRQLTLAPHAMSDGELFARAGSALRAAAKQAEFKGRMGWIGRAGVFCDDDTRFWLVADRGAEEPECGSLSRQGWIEWPGEHRRFLPRAWQSAEARRNVPIEQLAEVVLREWSQVRGGADDFQVQPLGLFLLAGQEEQASRGR